MLLSYLMAIEIRQKVVKAHRGFTPMPRAIPEGANFQKITQNGDFSGIKFLEKREVDRLINAPVFNGADDLAGMFREGGVYFMSPFTVPLYSNLDDSVYRAKSKVFLDLKPQADGSTNWQVIAYPNHARMKPFYFANGSFDAEFSQKMKSGKFSTEKDGDLAPIVQVGIDAIEPAADWAAVAFERILAEQIIIPRAGQGML